MRLQCKGIQKDGERCTNKPKGNGYCGNHQKQAPAEIDNDNQGHALQHTGMAGSSSSSSSSSNSSANHAGQDSAAMSNVHAADGGLQCQGLNKDGERCSDKPKGNRYCGRHQEQAPAEIDNDDQGHALQHTSIASSSSSSNSSSSANHARQDSAAMSSTGTIVGIAAASIHEFSACLRSDTRLRDLKLEAYNPFCIIEVAGCNGSTEPADGPGRLRSVSRLEEVNEGSSPLEVRHGGVLFSMLQQCGSS
eukprot:gene15001-biopygen416